MERPILRYCIQLGRELGRPLSAVLQFDESELLYQMAYDTSQSETFQAAYAAEKEKERQLALTPQQRSAEFARILGIEI